MRKSIRGRPPSIPNTNPYRGRPYKPKDMKCVNISISIPQKLLIEIEENSKGKSRSEKIVNGLLIAFPFNDKKIGEKENEKSI